MPHQKSCKVREDCNLKEGFTDLMLIENFINRFAMKNLSLHFSQTLKLHLV